VSFGVRGFGDTLNPLTSRRGGYAGRATLSSGPSANVVVCVSG